MGTHTAYFELAFCPTGPGGGIDNSCSGREAFKRIKEINVKIRELKAKHPDVSIKGMKEYKDLAAERSVMRAARHKKQQEAVAESNKEPLPTTVDVVQKAYDHAKIIASKPISNGNINGTEIVDMEGGFKGIYKPKSSEWQNAGPENIAHLVDECGMAKGTLAHREMASATIDKVLGFDLVPKCSLKNGPSGEGSVQEFVKGNDAQTALGSTIFHKSDGKLVPNPSYSEFLATPGVKDQVLKMRVFDYLTGNTDRHEGNYRITPDNKIKLTDNGISMHNPGTRHMKRNITSLLKADRGLQLTPDIRSGVQRLLKNKATVTKELELPKHQVSAFWDRVESFSKNMNSDAWRKQLFTTKNI